MKLSPKHRQKIAAAEQIALLLDYDGTLADFAPTPDHVIPDAGLIDLIQKLAAQPKIRPAVISGRRLAHIEKLVPVKGIWLAGSYGLEMRSPQGEYHRPLDFKQIRPILDDLKPKLTRLIEGKEGFYLEDKGWSLALHASLAEDDLAEQILMSARSEVEESVKNGCLVLLGGYKFLEVAPKGIDKGTTVTYLLEQYQGKSFLPIYLGDDDKDERAFPVVKEHGGLTGYVGEQNPNSAADFRLKKPEDSRRWLIQLLKTVSSRDQ